MKLPAIEKLEERIEQCEYYITALSDRLFSLEKCLFLLDDGGNKEKQPKRRQSEHEVF